MSKYTDDRLADVNERTEKLLAEVDSISATHGSDRVAWAPGILERHDRLSAGIAKLIEEAEALTTRANREKYARELVRKGGANVESGAGAALGGGATATRSGRRLDPWAGLGPNTARSDTFDGLQTRAADAIEQMDESVPVEGRERLARILDRDQSVDSAAFILAASDPAYVRAFEKLLSGPQGHLRWTEDEQRAYQRVDMIRATMAESGSATYLVPIPLDPTIVFTNSGIINPIRDLARVEQTASATWTGVASAGATATWTGENTAMTEGSGTFSQISVTPKKLTAWLTGSYELVLDTNLTAQLPQLIGDAFARAEGDAFVNGAGSSTVPQGIITAISATAGSTVTATTRGTFTSASVADVYAVDNALPARARSANPAWVANRKIINTIRQMSPAAAGSSFWATLAENTPATLLDHSLRESSAFPSTTTTGTVLAVLGDWRSLLVVDRIGTMVERVDNVVNASGVPTGTRGWIAWKRTGTVVSNLDSWRFLLA
jgi:HK97 family phage major capsid protein